MNKKIIIPLALLVTAALIFYLMPNDEKKIKHNLQLLAQYCSTDKKEGPIPQLVSADKAAKLCIVPCKVKVDSFGVDQAFSREEFSNHLIILKKMLPGTQFSFNDIHITFQQQDTATINTTVSLQGKTQNQRFTDAYELDITVHKSDGDWLFSSFSVVEFMER